MQAVSPRLDTSIPEHHQTWHTAEDTGLTVRRCCGSEPDVIQARHLAAVWDDDGNVCSAMLLVEVTEEAALELNAKLELPRAPGELSRLDKMQEKDGKVAGAYTKRVADGLTIKALKAWATAISITT